MEMRPLTAIRDEIKAGNLSLKMSKRFGRFDGFFIPLEKWRAIRGDFFRRSGLPRNPDVVKDYLKKRLNAAFDRFLEKLPQNTFAKIDEDGRRLGSSPPTSSIQGRKRSSKD
jgi:hypothetical protein